MSIAERCKDCIHYQLIAYRVRGGDKAKCQYSKSMLFNYTKACKKHFEKKGS